MCDGFNLRYLKATGLNKINIYNQCRAAAERNNYIMKKTNRFPICYWCGIPHKFLRTPDGKIDRSRVEEMKEAGINLIDSMYSPEENKEMLKIAEEMGLDVIVYDSRISDAIKDSDKRRELLFAVADDYKDYPALFSYHIVDEPTSAMFETLADVRKILGEADPEHEAYINLFPNYASPEQLGNATYAEHIEEYIKTVNPEIVSYDHYHFIKGEPVPHPEIEDERERMIFESACSKVERAGFFDNFEIVREICLKYNVPYMIIVLVVEHGPYRNLTEAEIRWEVFQSLAYGTERMCYFTYWTPGVDNADSDSFWHWKNGMISKDGERTEHYYMIKEINAELSKMGDALMNKKSIGVFHTNSAPETKTRLFDSFGAVKAIHGDDMTVGFFEGGYAVFANKSYEKECNADIFTDSMIEIFDTESSEWIAVESVDGKYSLSLDLGDGLLVHFLEKIKI